MSTLKATLCVLLLSGTILCLVGCITLDSNIGTDTSHGSESVTDRAPDTTAETLNIWEDMSETADTGETTGFPNEPEDGHTKRY